MCGAGTPLYRLIYPCIQGLLVNRCGDILRRVKYFDLQHFLAM